MLLECFSKNIYTAHRKHMHNYIQHFNNYKLWVVHWIYLSCPKLHITNHKYVEFLLKYYILIMLAIANM